MCLAENKTEAVVVFEGTKKASKPSIHEVNREEFKTVRKDMVARTSVI